MLRCFARRSLWRMCVEAKEGFARRSLCGMRGIAKEGPPKLVENVRESEGGLRPPKLVGKCVEAKEGYSLFRTSAGLLLAAFMVCDPIMMNAITNTASRPTNSSGIWTGVW